MHSVFISYSFENKAVAFGACKALEASGVTCWIAPRDVRAGHPDRGQISEAIRRARVLVLFLSQESDQSQQVLWEVERAAHSRLHLIAFQIEDFEPSDGVGYFVSAENLINAFEGVSPETHFSELLQRISALLWKGASEAPGEQAKPSPRAAPAGTERFGNYHILKRPDGTLFRLGPGAMGLTYKAFDTSLDRHVALKVIAASLLGSDEARRRFLREARAAAKIQHPHVAAVYHLGQEGEDYFYTMEFVDGEDMERYVQARGPLSPGTALRVVLQVAEALEAAQVQNLIHRDIKPANIMARVNRAGKLDVKLIDFGLAKGTGSASEDLSRVTHTMSFVGSPAYASPEQCEMDDLDARSDIYSLGATLWYLLTGKPPFAGNVNQVLIAHVVKPPPFEQLQGVPEPVVGLLRQMLAKRPDDRPKDPQTLQETIEGLIASYSWGTPGRVSAGLKCLPAESLENADFQAGSDVQNTVSSRSLDVYQRVDVGVLVAERYRLIEEQPEGNGGRLFLAHEEKAGRASPVHVALKLIHPEIALESFDLLEEEIKLIKGAAHPNLVGYSGLEKAASGPFIVREWVHGFLLYELLRLRRSLKPEEVLALLEPLPAVLNLISEQGLGLVDVSIRKLFVSCPLDVRPDEFTSLAKGDARAWAKCMLKLNPLCLGTLLFRERSDGSSQTLVPSSRVLSMTQTELGIRGTKAVRLLGRLVYELIRGQAPSWRSNERPSPLPLLNESGNQALWKAWATVGEATPYLNCEEFWRVFKDCVISDRIRPVTRPLAKPDADNPAAKTRKTDAKVHLPAERRLKQRLEPTEHELQSPPANPVAAVASSTSSGKRKLRPIHVIMTMLMLVICAGGGAAIYFTFRRPERQAALESTVQPAVSATTPMAAATPGPPPSVEEWLSEAQHYLALKDFPKALPALQKAAAAGDPTAMENLGALYRGGKGVPQDYAKARVWFQSAAEAGNAVAMTNLGELYGNGKGVSPDLAKARVWSIEAADAGNAVAMTNLGLLFRNGPYGTEDDEKAAEWFQKAADAGDAIAMTNLGLLYENGKGIGQDYSKAREWYQKGADAGDAIAMTLLGALYQNGKGGGQDCDQAREWYQKAADAGDTNAANDLGLLYENGKGLPQDYGKAREWYQKAADAGHLVAMINLALLYEEGKGGAKDDSKAREWYQKAADASSAITMTSLGLLYDSGEGVGQDNGDVREWFRKATSARDMINVAWLYEQGKGVGKDYDKMREWFQKAADTGDAMAIGDLGLLYQDGEGVPRDYGKACELFEKAAKAGDARSMTNLALLYENGKGVRQDNGKAREWYQKAADTGSVIAMTNLAVLYYFGKGGPQDYGEAREWFEKAANAGNPKAMFNLGVMYRDGSHVQQDYGKARDWFQKAADAGDSDARKALSDLRNVPR